MSSDLEVNGDTRHVMPLGNMIIAVAAMQTPKEPKHIPVYNCEEKLGTKWKKVLS